MIKQELEQRCQRNKKQKSLQKISEINYLKLIGRPTF